MDTAHFPSHAPIGVKMIGVFPCVMVVCLLLLIGVSIKDSWKASEQTWKKVLFGTLFIFWIFSFGYICIGVILFFVR